MLVDEHALISETRSLVDVANYLGDTGLSLAQCAGIEITEISSSTESVMPGALFVAHQGIRSHGAEYASRAISAGASAILTDQKVRRGSQPKVSAEFQCSSSLVRKSI